MINRWCIRWVAGMVLLSVVLSQAQEPVAQETSPTAAPPPTGKGSPPTGWMPSAQLAFVHQFPAGLEDGGRMAVNRYFAQAGLSYLFTPRRSVSLVAGYGGDAYDFSGVGPLAARPPWDFIHSLRLASVVRWQINTNWSVMAIPMLRFTAEEGAGWSDALTGGAISGFFYRFNDKLSIGPGFGVISQLKDSASFFPVLFIRWEIMDGLSLETGRGLGATQGPGLVLQWRLNHRWSLAMGGRYERWRFRLNGEEPVPGGIGEDRTIPLYAGVSFRPVPFLQMDAFVGAALGGRMSADAANGELVLEQDHTTAPFAGLSFGTRY